GPPDAAQDVVRDLAIEARREDDPGAAGPQRREGLGNAVERRRRPLVVGALEPAAEVVVHPLHQALVRPSPVLREERADRLTLVGAHPAGDLRRPDRRAGVPEGLLQHAVDGAVLLHRRARDVEDGEVDAAHAASLLATLGYVLRALSIVKTTRSGRY